MQNAIVFIAGNDDQTFTAGKGGVVNVFPSNNNNEPNTLVVVYEDKIVKYVGIPFISTSPRKDKDIEA